MVPPPKMKFSNETFREHPVVVHESCLAIQYHEYQVSEVPTISKRQSKQKATLANCTLTAHNLYTYLFPNQIFTVKTRSKVHYFQFS